jgi:hypothetical protein
MDPPYILYDDTFETVTKQYLNLRDLYCLKLSNQLHYYNIDMKSELRKYIDCLLGNIFGSQKEIIKSELVKSNSFILDRNIYHLLYNNIIHLEPTFVINKTFNIKLIKSKYGYLIPCFTKSCVFTDLLVDSTSIGGNIILIYQYDLPHIIGEYNIYGKFSATRDDWGTLINMSKIYEKINE